MKTAVQLSLFTPRAAAQAARVVRLAPMASPDRLALAGRTVHPQPAAPPACLLPTPATPPPVSDPEEPHHRPAIRAIGSPSAR